ncbi:MAG: molybdopterin-guanine dinucleotide biosynthesis protein B [Clostridiales bacterium]|nr:molybdopterin-guanine dinucleotide biosynthesis protein B [Clostridiales bacterium]
MRVIGFIGYSKTGKTTSILSVIKELRARGYSVGTVKDIKHGNFMLDTGGKNSYRHREAGAVPVTARGDGETGILFPGRLPAELILRHYQNDFVLLEGIRDFPVPQILTGTTEQQLEERVNGRVFAVCGRIANELQNWRGLPVINAAQNAAPLVDLILQKAAPYREEGLGRLLADGAELELSPGTLAELSRVLRGRKADLKFAGE